METHGKDIRRLRLDLDLTQAEFARYIGYESVEQINRLENDKRPVPHYIRLLVKVLSQSPEARAIANSEFMDWYAERFTS